jgi:hypothetical protein
MRLLQIGALLAALPLAASADEPATRLLAGLEEHVQAEDRELFEMCCWARGRAGFNHCTQYGVCVDQPGAVCVGRGAAEGRELQCPADGDSKVSDADSPLPVSGRSALPTLGL